jgi:hypothetical protein
VNIPEPVSISPADYKKLLKLDGDLKAIQQMMQMFQATCQARLAETQGEARAIWGKIAQETGIDMKNVSWEPHPEQPLVVPVQMRING